MRYEFKLPDLAEGMVEGEVVNWLVAPGDAIQEEQPIVEVMTDKATVVISSPVEGKMMELAFEAGDIAPVGQTLFVLETDGAAASESASLALSRYLPETSSRLIGLSGPPFWCSSSASRTPSRAKPAAPS